VNLNLHSQEAEIWINTQKVSKDTISNNLYGSFIEFLNHFVNGPKGMWAQELLNRGFDMPDYDWNGTSHHWYKYGDSIKSENIWSLDTNNQYNLNGKFSQLLKSSLNNEIGITQNIFLNDSISHTFYIYFKGENTGPLFFTLRDLSNNIIFQEAINNIDADWKKAQISVPAIKGYNNVKLIISIKTAGYVIIDEASLMPDNNLHGIRYELFKLYEKWKPGIFRYPGGWFADSRQNKLEYCIGDIDQRKSPNIAIGDVSQRMDFGLHEYIWFCDTIGIEPQITLNVGSGNANEAANYFEYCNSDTNSIWGKLRANNGNVKPFNVKYWEIGNEQWGYEKEYAKKYLTYYDVIKSFDSSAIVIIDGNHWDGLKNFDELFDIVGNKCDIYSYHPTLNAVPETPVSDELYFLNMACQNNLYEVAFFSEFQKLLEQRNYFPAMKQGTTEWWTNYGSSQDWLLDTNYRNSSLESGICCAGMLVGMMKFEGKIVLAERTHGLGLMRTEINPLNAERHFFGTPSYHALEMLRNHHGKYVIGSTIVCDYYSLDFIKGFWSLPTNPYVDGVVTASEDTIYISVFNRYFNKNLNLKIASNYNFLGREATIYRLWSENVADANTYHNPVKVVPSEYKWVVQDNIELLPHSFYIIAIPASDAIAVDEETIQNYEPYIFPNPCRDYIKVQIPGSDLIETEINLFDLLGNKLDIKVIQNNNEYFLSLSEIASGVYYFSIKLSDKTYFRQFIKY
jgi:alpha-N-arabinofuranosidase